MGQPMVDIAYDLMSKKKKEIVFSKLWEEVSQIKGLTQAQADDLIAQFYTDISLDDRFVHLQENKWDLRSRHKFEDVVIDTEAIMVDDDEDEEEMLTEEGGKEEEE
ncbi:MAG: DNA-directed RNA polymerase subunit delta [Erysipelotrichia bacterium]|nr:DNA-directed RNA polymerase subunit delta [Erysipelotrichia bacterium]NCC54729.1 DNA-directed RNA polymerase subunit delta [Erysipelotrichia bacterium]